MKKSNKNFDNLCEITAAANAFGYIKQKKKSNGNIRKLRLYKWGLYKQQ